MTAREIYDLALRGGGNDFQATVELLERLGEPWCLIGGLAINVYCEPVYTNDALSLLPASSNWFALSLQGSASSFPITGSWSMSNCRARTSLCNSLQIPATKIFWSVQRPTKC